MKTNSKAGPNAFAGLRGSVPTGFLGVGPSALA
jgi:hypothetical protein